jgi:hypothetical protein
VIFAGMVVIVMSMLGHCAIEWEAYTIGWVFHCFAILLAVGMAAI